MEDDKVLTPQEIWQMQLEHQRKIEKELDKLTSPGPDWQEDLEMLMESHSRAYIRASMDDHADAYIILSQALSRFIVKYHTKKQNHD